MDNIVARYSLHALTPFALSHHLCSHRPLLRTHTMPLLPLHSQHRRQVVQRRDLTPVLSNQGCTPEHRVVIKRCNPEQKLEEASQECREAREKCSCLFSARQRFSDCLTRRDSTSPACVTAAQQCVVQCPTMAFENGKIVNVRAQWKACKAKQQTQSEECQRWRTQYQCGDNEKKDRLDQLKKGDVVVIAGERFQTCEWFCPDETNKKVHATGKFDFLGVVRVEVPSAPCAKWNEKVGPALERSLSLSLTLAPALAPPHPHPHPSLSP